VALFEARFMSKTLWRWPTAHRFSCRTRLATQTPWTKISLKKRKKILC